MLSLVIPLYKSEPNLPRLFAELPKLADRLGEPLEVVFVDDGSPDRCAEILRERLPEWSVRSRLVQLSRNFGAFPAIAAGLRAGQGEYFAVLAADLQEPPELIASFLHCMKRGDVDVVFGYRLRRSDPVLTTLASNLFWGFYRRFVIPEIPKGGVDVFGCTRQVRDQATALREVETNLVALLFWVGFRRAFIGYERVPRREGNSAWNFAKRLRYSFNSVFSFTDLPIQFLLAAGLAGTATAFLWGLAALVGRLTGHIQVDGYTALIIAVTFFGGITTLGLGIVGQYLWLSFQNTKQRPPFIVRGIDGYDGHIQPRAARDNQDAR